MSENNADSNISAANDAIESTAVITRTGNIPPVFGVIFKFFSAITGAIGRAGRGLLTFFGYTGLQWFRVYKAFFRRVGRILVKPWRWLCAVLRVAWIAVDTMALRSVHAVGREIREFRADISRVSKNIFNALSKSIWTFLKTISYYIRTSFKAHGRLFVTLLNIVLPVLAVVGLWQCVLYWHNSVFALNVNYEGKNLGYVSDESVYYNALSLAKTRVANYGGDTTFDAYPTYTLERVTKSQLSDSSVVCDNLIESSDSVIGQACGIYVDGSFICSIKNETDAVAVLDEILNGYSSGAENERIEFVQDVERVQGLFPVDTLWSIDELRELLTGVTPIESYYTVQADDTIESICGKAGITEERLRELNPDLGQTLKADTQIIISSDVSYLKVKVIRTEVRIEDKPFSTTEVDDPTRYVGSRVVTTHGVVGQDQVTEDVTYIDGVETERTELMRVVLSEPVTEVVNVGTKKYSPRNGSGQVSVVPTSGRFCWPCPGVTQISSWFGSRWGRQHGALDITGNCYGKPAVAADNGTVVSAGWSGGYGNCVIIDHGDGYQTVYAHLSAITCYVGQSVTMGQKIGEIGSTGFSTGPHLHFEVRYNGVKQDPAPYLGLY